MSDTVIRCRCNRSILAVLDEAGRLRFKGDGKQRTVVGAEAVQCDKCGFVLPLDKMAVPALA